VTSWYLLEYEVRVRNKYPKYPLTRLLLDAFAAEARGGGLLEYLRASQVDGWRRQQGVPGVYE